MSELPRTAVYVARAQLAAVALVVIVALVGGVGMQLELWAPGPLWTQHRYGDMLGLHALASVAIGAPALAGCFGYLAVSHLVGARRVAAPAIAWIAFGSWVIGAGVMAYAAVLPADTGWSLYTPYSLESPSVSIVRLVGPLALAIAGLVYALHLATIVAGGLRQTSPEKLAIAAAFVLAIVGACTLALLDAIAIATRGDLVLGPALGGYAMAGRLTTAAALVLATATLVGERGLVLALLAIAGGVLWAFAPMFVLGLGVVGVWIALAVVNRFGRPAVAFVVFGCGPAIIMLGLARVLSDVEGGSFLHDTYFAVGSRHLSGAVVAFAALAAVHAWGGAILRPPHPHAAWIGGVTCSAGMLLHVYASLRIGASGMPRRYWDYDPMFADGFALAGVGSGIVLVGLLVIGVGWLLGDRASQRER